MTLIEPYTFPADNGLTDMIVAAAATHAGGQSRQRRCAATREPANEADLIRFVQGPDNVLVPDLKRKLPGRGVWVTATRAAVEQAIEKRAFSQGLKAKVAVRSDLADQIARLMHDALLGRLGLARKAGQAVAGFSKVEAAIGGQKVLAVISASDGAEDGRRKIRAALTRADRAAMATPVIELFHSDELGLAFGRTNVIHAAVLRGSAGESFLDAASRLLRYEGAAPSIIAQAGTALGSSDQSVLDRQDRSDATHTRADDPQGSTE